MRITTGRIVIASMKSGDGKTFATSTLTALFSNLGHVVQPFKYSADFIDSHISSCASKIPARNLSYWTHGEQTIRDIFARNAPNGDFSIIEGGGGLMDGASMASLKMCTAHVARILHAPVILIVNVETAPFSVVLFLRGIRDFAPWVDIRGILWNKVRDVQRHYEKVSRLVAKHTGVSSLGYLPYREEWKIPEIFYPLLPPEYDRHIRTIFRESSNVARKTVDVDAILRIISSAKSFAIRTRLHRQSPSRIRVAVADDIAFHKLFLENIDTLERLGADLIPISPMTDVKIPPDADGLYISGRFPESFGRELSSNTDMLDSIRSAADRGMPIYADGGGLKYLSNVLIDQRDHRFRMAECVPAEVRATEKAGRYGFVKIKALRDTPFINKGASAKGYLLPYSLVHYRSHRFPLRLTNTTTLKIFDGFTKNNLFASAACINFLTCPSIARNFVRLCAEYKKRREKRLQ